MSTTVELVRANERYARLRAAVEGLAAEWENDHGILSPDSRHTRDVMVREVRALLAAVDP